MVWNHRVIREALTPKEAELQDEEFFYTIREVFYFEDGKPELVTMKGDAPWGTTLEELQQDVEWFSKALGQPTLNYEDFGGSNMDREPEDGPRTPIDGPTLDDLDDDCCTCGNMGDSDDTGPG